MKNISEYKNGNALISIYDDGTRIIKFENELKLEYPLNIDIRVSTQCSFGKKPDGSSGFCTFCHESAKVNGIECNYEKLKEKLNDLPQGIELAIGCNNMTVGLKNFIIWCSFNKKYICNVTINQGHTSKNWGLIEVLINQGYIKGLGISYRSSLKWNVPQSILDYQNTVFHVIAGIDDIDDIKELYNKGVNKILILGEKLIHLFFTENGVYTHFDIKNPKDIGGETIYKYWAYYCDTKEITFNNGKKFDIHIAFEELWNDFFAYNRKRFLSYLNISKEKALFNEPIILVEYIGKVDKKTIRYQNSIYKITYNPNLSQMGIYFDEDFIWQSLVEFLSNKRSEKEISPEVSNENKILSKGFDLKTSFRPNMKKKHKGDI